jgi:hypothetical protein
MGKMTMVVLILCCAASVSCVDRSPIAPLVGSRLEVHVSWQGQSLPDRRLEILELGLEQKTNAEGIALFSLAAGSHTLRAFVNAGGPAAFRDFSVTTRAGETEHVEVADCLPCVSAR